VWKCPKLEERSDFQGPTGDGEKGSLLFLTSLLCEQSKLGTIFIAIWGEPALNGANSRESRVEVLMM
jgi:hypothetical protein